MLMNKTLLGAGGIGILSGIYWWEAKSLPIGTSVNPGIGYAPNLLGEIGFGLCVLLVALTYFENRGQTEAKSDFAGEETGPGPWITAASLLLYPICLENLGFVLGTTPLAFSSLWVMGYRHRLKALVIAVVMVLALYYVFSEWLSVQFPPGLLVW